MLKCEYKDFLVKAAGDAVMSGEQNAQLNNHHRFYNLVIHKKVVYTHIRIEEVINKQ